LTLQGIVWITPLWKRGDLKGGQHYKSEGKEKDRARDKYMNGIGLKVLKVF
jgi:hypothetical protein